MLALCHVFNDPLCSKLCWHNRRVPTPEEHEVTKLTLPDLLAKANAVFKFGAHGMSWILKQ